MAIWARHCTGYWETTSLPAATEHLGGGRANKQSSEVSVSFFYLTQVTKELSCDENKMGQCESKVSTLGLAGLVMLGCAVAINWNTLSAYAKTLPAKDCSTAWYAMPQQAETNAGRPPGGR